MKPLIIILLLFQQVQAQDSLYGHLPVIDGRVNYTEVFSVDSLSKDKIFTKIKDWAVNSYKSSKATLEAEDKDAGYIAYKGLLPIALKYHTGIIAGRAYEVDIYHTIKFYIKDGKVKMVFTDLGGWTLDYAKALSRDIIPIEEESQVDLSRYNDKKKKKTLEDQSEDAAAMNTQFVSFLEGVKKYLQTRKSEFDF